MLKKITEISSKDLQMLLSFVNIPVGKNLIDTLNNIIDNKKIKYSELLEATLLKGDLNEKIDVTDIYDQLMFECYDIYYHLKGMLKEVHKEYSEFEALNSMWDYIFLYEKLLRTSKFESASTKTIQKMYFEKILKEEIENENYLYCSELKKTINYLTNE